MPVIAVEKNADAVLPEHLGDLRGVEAYCLRPVIRLFGTSRNGVLERILPTFRLRLPECWPTAA